MTDSRKDPLAEHLLGEEPTAPSGRPEKRRPDLGETPITRGAVAPAPALASVPAAASEEGAETETTSDSTPGVIAFGRRAAAGLADLVILGLFGAVELAAGALVLELRFPPQALLGVGALLLLAAFVLLVLVPFVWGTTPGMALADLRIAAPDGGSPTLSAAFLRFLGFLLTGALAGVPLLVAAFDRRGRTLSDLMSGTVLVPAR